MWKLDFSLLSEILHRIRNINFCWYSSNGFAFFLFFFKVSVVFFFYCKTFNLFRYISMHFTSAENTTSKNFSGNRRFWLNVQNFFFSIHSAIFLLRKLHFCSLLRIYYTLQFSTNNLKFFKNNNIYSFLFSYNFCLQY